MNMNLQNTTTVGTRWLEWTSSIAAAVMMMGVLLLVAAISVTDLGYQIGPLALNVLTSTMLGIIMTLAGLLVLLVSLRRLAMAARARAIV